MIAMSSAFTGIKPKLSLSPDNQYECRFFRHSVRMGSAARQYGHVIYSNLGANADKIPYLFLAAPLTGLLVQPV